MGQSAQLTSDEKKQIRKKIAYELTDKYYHVLKNASYISIIAALLPVWAFYHIVPQARLMGWYVTLVMVHLACIALVFYYQHCHPSIANIKPWQNAVRLAVIISTAAWGSVGALLVPDTASGQAFILLFLIIISSAIAIGTSLDYIISSIAILCALMPFALWHIHAGIVQHSDIHLQTGATLVLYMVFLLIFSYISHRLMKNSAELSFKNIALADKLATAMVQLQEVNYKLEQKVEERTATIKYQATHDDLTGLVNKDDLLTDEINALISFAYKTGSHFALIYLTLNNLQEITDNYGIKPDTDAVKEMAQRLSKHLVGHKVMLNRRDAFAILIHPITRAQIDETLDKITAIVDEPFTLQIDNKMQSIFLRASIGVTLYPDNGTDAETLKMNTDLTMSYAKQIAPERTRYLLCSNDTAQRIRMESQLKRDLPRALNKGEFYLVYQPVIDLKSGKICGAEALIRWHHPTFGIVATLDFIEMAERSGEIIPLGLWVLQQACMQTKAWHDQGYTSFKIAVNLSARQLESPTLVSDIKKILTDIQLDPQFLELEMTETAEFNVDDIDVLRKIDSLGIDIAIDDFGQGNSGLNSLNDFDFIKKIKLDRAFIKNIPENARSREIVINSVNLARGLSKKIKVVAEGVETSEQLPFLKEQGIDMVQGYYFSKPISDREFAKFLQDHPRFNI